MIKARRKHLFLEDAEQFGQRDQALKQIELALRKGTRVDELERAPAIKELRSDPRYSRLIDKWGKKP